MPGNLIWPYDEKAYTTRFKKDGTLEIFNKTVTVKRVVKQFRLNIEQYM